MFNESHLVRVRKSLLLCFGLSSHMKKRMAFPPDLLHERDNVQLQIVNYIFYGNGKPIPGISDTNIQSVRTCLVLNWDQDKKSSSSQEARASFVEIRNDSPGSRLFSDNGSDCTNINPLTSVYSRARIQQPLNKNHKTIHTLLNRNTEFQSVIILSSSNCFRMGPFNDRKYHRILANNYLHLDNLKQTFHGINYYLIGEIEKIYNPDACSNIIFNLNWDFIHPNYCQETSTIMSLWQFICENICITKNAPHLKSGQVILVQVDSVVIRSAKPYLATPGATVHDHYREILYKGDTLITFIYEKSRSGDITQGLPKVEQVVEVRSIDSISMNLEKRVEG
ncbi:DNA-directed RNA polymerase subunit beta'' [Striga asiatica]|uniref:DNA-directed RNA polymerase subunit beta n=1 Tax=Striga asiatica TaxID=4170 RepID=A0A5A7P9T4_STRAF|nr:DNA-directed RNA polymerase subunit beta'' [Striga asiatica]